MYFWSLTQWKNQRKVKPKHCQHTHSHLIKVYKTAIICSSCYMCYARFSQSGYSLTSSMGSSQLLVGRCTYTVIQVCPRKHRSPYAGYWWFCSSPQPVHFPVFSAVLGHHSWSRTSPSDSTDPQGSLRPAAPAA